MSSKKRKKRLKREASKNSVPAYLAQESAKEKQSRREIEKHRQKYGGKMKRD